MVDCLGEFEVRGEDEIRMEKKGETRLGIPFEKVMKRPQSRTRLFVIGTRSC